MKGYKGFDKDFKCKGKQYQENTVFEESEAKICRSGIHFCKNPLDVLDYYPLIDDDCKLNQFAEVESLDEVFTDDNKKYCTKKLKVGAKLNLKGLIEASVDFLFNQENLSDDAQLASSGDDARLASSGDDAQLASSGDFARLASSGDYSQLASIGYGSQLASSGNYSKLVIDGERSVGANIGIDGKIKGIKGTWITLAEYKYDYEKNKNVCVCVKSGQIDGERLKEDTWYQLKNGEFVEV